MHFFKLNKLLLFYKKKKKYTNNYTILKLGK
jgi:hypothetical protein